MSWKDSRGSIKFHRRTIVLLSFFVFSVLLLSSMASAANFGSLQNTHPVPIGKTGINGSVSLFDPIGSNWVEMGNSTPFIPVNALPVSGIDPSLNITVFIGLQLQNTSVLNSLLTAVSTPNSLLYRHFISHNQFESSFEPSQSSFNGVVSYYEGYGIHFTPSNDRLFMTLTGSIKDFSAAFNTNFSLYSIAGETFYFNSAPLYVPSQFSSLVTSAIGFTNYTYMIPSLLVNPASGLNATQVFSAGNNGFGGAASPQPPYTPYALQLAYNETGLLSKNFGGQYITVAVTDAYGDPTAQSDLALFDELYNQPSPGSFQVLTPFGSSNVYGAVQAVEQTWEIETALDIEMSHTFAPNANLISVVTPDAGYTLTQSIVYLIVNQLANVISNSWGGPEPEIGTQAAYLHPFLEMAAMEGITVLAASGDQGAAGYDTAVPRSVMWPSDDPLVTAVGGTTLVMNGTFSPGVSNPLNGPPSTPEIFNPTGWLNESAWDGYSGGGYSVLYSRPSWQHGYGVPSAGQFSNVRGVPDVAANAMFGGNDFVFNGLTAGSYLFGGTSFASPMWAGIIATIDSYATAIQGGMLGFVNPALYAILNSPVYNQSFHDILYGYNGPAGYYNAGPGWDPVTGLGSPNVGFLASELAEYSFSAGVQSDYSSSNNTGASANIQTVVPENIISNSADYFYIYEKLSDQTVLELGYTVSPSVPEGAWFYTVIPSSSLFGTEQTVIGLPGSAGSDNSVNQYSISYSGNNVWGFYVDGNLVGSISESSVNSGEYSPAFLATASGTTTDLNQLGPVIFSSLAYINSGQSLPIKSVKSVELVDIYSSFTPPFAFSNPYGVQLYPSENNAVIVGSGIAESNGSVLWGTYLYPPVKTLLLNTPQYVYLYAQNVQNITNGSGTNFPMNTVFPYGQGDFNSYYLVPVEGPSSWSFSLNTSTTDEIVLSQSTPIIVHFFVSLGVPAGISSLAAVPLTIAVSSHVGYSILGSGTETLNLTPTGTVTEYNVTFLPQLSKITSGSFISMTVTWYVVAEAGEFVSYTVSPHSGHNYPISMELPMLDPVDVSPVSFISQPSSLMLSSMIQSPFGIYDLGSVKATINGLQVSPASVHNNIFSWNVPNSGLLAGSNEFVVTAYDLQNNFNRAILNFSHSSNSISYAMVNSTSIGVYSIPGAEEFSTVPYRSVQINYVSLYLSGSGQVQFSIGSSVFHSQYLANITINVVTGTNWYNVSFPTVTISGDSYLNLFDTTGRVSWGYTTSPVVDTNALADYYYIGPNLKSDNSYPFIFTVGYNRPPASYIVNFTENGLPRGEEWGVTVNGSSYTSTTSTISVNLVNGSYSYSLLSVQGYTGSPSKGTLTVAGSSLSIDIAYTQIPSTAVAYSFVNSTSIYTYSLPGAEEFTVSGSGQVTANYVTLYLQGSGEVEFSIGTSLWHSQILQNVTIMTNQYTEWYNVSVASLSLQGGEDYYLNVFLVSGNVQLGYSSAPTIHKNNIADYWYSGGTLHSDNSYPDIYSIGFRGSSPAQSIVRTSDISSSGIFNNFFDTEYHNVTPQFSSGIALILMVADGDVTILESPLL